MVVLIVKNDFLEEECGVIVNIVSVVVFDG